MTRSNVIQPREHNQQSPRCSVRHVNQGFSTIPQIRIGQVDRKPMIPAKPSRAVSRG